VRIDGTVGNWIKISKVIRQRCALSYKILLPTGKQMVKVNQKRQGQNINNVRYADDTTPIADSSDRLQTILDTVVRESDREGLHLNIKKTVCMVITKRLVAPT